MDSVVINYMLKEKEKYIIHSIFLNGFKFMDLLPV